MKLSRSTVYRTLKSGEVSRKKGSCNFSKLTKTDFGKIKKYMKSTKKRFIPKIMDFVRKEISSSTSQQSIRRLLIKNGAIFTKTVPAIILSESHKNKRVKFAKMHLKDSLKRYLFIDAKSIENKPHSKKL